MSATLQADSPQKTAQYRWVGPIQGRFDQSAEMNVLLEKLILRALIKQICLVVSWGMLASWLNLAIRLMAGFIVGGLVSG